MSSAARVSACSSHIQVAQPRKAWMSWCWQRDITIPATAYCNAILLICTTHTRCDVENTTQRHTHTAVVGSVSERKRTFSHRRNRRTAVWGAKYHASIVSRQLSAVRRSRNYRSLCTMARWEAPTTLPHHHISFEKIFSNIAHIISTFQSYLSLTRGVLVRGHACGQPGVPWSHCFRSSYARGCHSRHSERESMLGTA